MDVFFFHESLGVEICGLVCDDGGSNESFLHSIVGKFILDEKVATQESVRFTHPLDKCRRIFIWSCGTHSQKALRNSMYRRRHNGTRNLTYCSNNFGWNELQTIYGRKEERSKRQQYRETDVVQQTINLDSFTMMNTTYAKQPFTSNTLPEVFSHLSTMLDMKLDYNQTYPS